MKKNQTGINKASLFSQLNWKEVITGVSAFSLILLFMYTAFSKYFDMGLFRYAMEKQPVPEWSKPILLYSLPAAEILAALALLFPRSRKWGFYASIVLMLAFTLYIGAGMAHVFSKVPCVCGGVFQTLDWGPHFVFNIIFLALAVIGAFFEQRKDLPPTIGRPAFG